MAAGRSRSGAVRGSGGTVVAEGPPEFVATVPESHTGRYLAQHLDADAVAAAAAPKKRVRKKAS
ncbi:MAG: hypothetical protein ABWY29_00995 [Blastococcus sp.]